MKPLRTSRIHVGITALAALLSLAAQAAFAQDIWIRLPADGPGLWTDGLNWSNGNPPNGPGNEEGRIDNGGTALVDDSQTDPFTGILGEIVTGSLTLGSQPGASGNLLMTSGKFTLKNTDFRIGGSIVGLLGSDPAALGGTGVFTQTGGTVIQQGGNLNIGIRGNNDPLLPGVAEGTYNLSGDDSSYTVMFGFIIAIGNRAMGTLNQSGGTIEVKNLAATNNGTLGSRIQLGRNALNGTTYTSGTYNLSGGSATAALFQFGHAAQTTGSSTNTFNLSGTGTLQTGTIEFLNTTTATNTFNFTGGTLAANTISIPVTNNGGTLSPYFADFATVTAFSSVAINPIGTTTFTGSNPYTQSATGNLAIDIDLSGNDLVDIGAGADVVSASLAGKITVNLINNFDPPVGNTFDILTADTVTNTASVIGHTLSCNVFQASIVAGGDGREVLRLTVVPPPDTYAEYQGLYGAGAFTSDDDSDGLRNGVEYLLGTLPNDPNGLNGASGGPTLSLAGAGPGQRIQFSVPEPGPADATLRVEASDDLGVTDPWTTIAMKVGTGPWTGLATINVDPPADCKTQVIVEDIEPIAGTPTRFLRLRAEIP